MPDTSQAPWWAQYAGTIAVALIGSGALFIEGIRKWKSGYGRVEARNLEAQAHKAEAEAAQIGNARSVEFERAVNERTFRAWDLLELQIKHLSDLVEAQSLKMDQMEQEIINLRKSLDDRTSELHRVKEAKLDLVCPDYPCDNLLQTNDLLTTKGSHVND